MKEDKAKIMTAEEWAEGTRELIKPIDFDTLIEAGVLEKKGAWYKVLKYNELPSHVRAKVIAMKQTTVNDKITETLVKFSKPSRSLEKLLENYEKKVKK